MKMRPRKDLAWRRIAGELFIVDAAGSRLHELNGTAALAWEGLAAGRDQAAVARAIAGEYEVGLEEASADVAAFAAELAAAGLLEKADK